MLGIPERYKPYSVGRVRILRKLGNPFFGADDVEGDKWDFDERLGTAWVVFTREFDEINELMCQANPREEFRKLWDGDGMHASEQQRLYDWIMAQIGMTEAAQTEAIKERGGKSQGEQAATVATG